MFCPKCGKEIPENSKFCNSCGSRLDNSYSFLNVGNANRGKIKYSTSIVINVVISVIMTLSMIMLPMFELHYDKYYKYKKYTISLLGDNYMAGYGIRNGIVIFSRLAFIFMVASIIAIVIFKITNRRMYGVISSGVNLGTLIVYDLYVHTAWINRARSYDYHTTIIGAGNVLCIGCAVALFVLSLRELKKDGQNIKLILMEEFNKKKKELLGK